MSVAIYKSCVVRCVKIVSSGLFVVNLCIHQIPRKDSSRIASYSILDAYKIEYMYVQYIHSLLSGRWMCICISHCK